MASIERGLLWFFSVLLLADVLVGVAARYIDLPVVFADELGKYLFIWLCMTGIVAATRDDQHVRLTFIANRLPLPRKTVRIISYLLFLAFSLFFTYWSARLTWMHYTMEKSVMGFHFPMYWFTAALPAGFALNTARIIQKIAATARKSKPVEANEPEELVMRNS